MINQNEVESPIMSGERDSSSDGSLVAALALAAVGVYALSKRDGSSSGNEGGGSTGNGNIPLSGGEGSDDYTPNDLIENIHDQHIADLTAAILAADREDEIQREMCVEQAMLITDSEIGCKVFDRQRACPDDGTFFDIAALNSDSSVFVGFTLRQAVEAGAAYYTNDVIGIELMRLRDDIVDKAGRSNYNGEYNLHAAVSAMGEQIASYCSSVCATATNENVLDRIFNASCAPGGKTLRQYWAAATWKRLGYRREDGWKENTLCDYGDTHCVGLNQQLMTKVIQKGVEIMRERPAVREALIQYGRSRWEGANGVCIKFGNFGHDCDADRRRALDRCDSLGSSAAALEPYLIPKG